MSEIFNVRHNISAMFAHRQATLNNGTLTKALERLSSGYRINRASDDAAGLAVSEKLRTQVRGYQVAARNIQDGQSMVQTAESALQTVHDILQRMRELAVQAANGVYSDSDRSLIQLEVDQLINELDRMSTSVEFNEKKILGPKNTKADIVFGIDTGSAVTTPALAGLQASLTTLTDALKKANIDFRLSLVTVGDGSVPEDTRKVLDFTNNITAFQAALNAVAVDFDFSPGYNAIANLFNVYTPFVGTMNGGIPSYASDAKRFLLYAPENDDPVGTEIDNLASGAPPGPPNTNANGEAAARNILLDPNVDGKTDDTVTTYVLTNDLVPGTIAAYDALVVDNDLGVINSNQSVAAYQTDIMPKIAQDIIDKAGDREDPISIQASANKNGLIMLDLPADVRAGNLHVYDVSVLTQAKAESAIGKIDDGINRVSRMRAKLGAQSNRLDHAYQFALVAAEGMQSAESRIRDTDMAAEMIEFTKAQVLSQAANAMLAQANLRPQNVLTLLG